LLPQPAHLLTAADAATHAGQAEPPPPGFEWVRLKEISGQVLKPQSWHVTTSQRTKDDGPLLYQITQEDIEKSGGFKTGLTINVYEKVDKHHGMPPSEFAVGMMRRYTAKGQVETFKDGIRAGEFQVARARLRRIMPLLGVDTETIVTFTTIANDKTGTCYLIIFGTPAADWPAHEPLLKQMSQIDLDDER
ncbi:MAG: hypothetical protein ACO1TE_14150, partial [Prosthecobacter sp.]